MRKKQRRESSTSGGLSSGGGGAVCAAPGPEVTPCRADSRRVVAVATLLMKGLVGGQSLATRWPGQVDLPPLPSAVAVVPGAAGVPDSSLSNVDRPLPLASLLLGASRRAGTLGSAGSLEEGLRRGPTSEWWLRSMVPPNIGASSTSGVGLVSSVEWGATACRCLWEVMVRRQAAPSAPSAFPLLATRGEPVPTGRSTRTPSVTADRSRRMTAVARMLEVMRL